MSAPAPETVDIGAALKKARVERGLSLESVQQKIRIQKKFLEAMEANQLKDFPAPVYLRGFFKTYCEFLDLDADGLWAQVEQARQAAPKPAAPLEPPRPAPSLQIPAGAIALAAGGLGVLALGGILWFQAAVKSPTIPPAPPKQAAPISPLYPKQAMRLSLHYKKRTWIRISGDGKLLFEGWVPADADQKDWRAMEKFQIRTPSPEGLEVRVEDRETPLDTWTRQGSGEFSFLAPLQ